MKLLKMSIKAKFRLSTSAVVLLIFLTRIFAASLSNQNIESASTLRGPQLAQAADFANPIGPVSVPQAIHFHKTASRHSGSRSIRHFVGLILAAKVAPQFVRRFSPAGAFMYPPGPDLDAVPKPPNC